MRPDSEKFFAVIGGIGALLALIVSAMTIYHAVRPSHPPTFSGSIGQYSDAENFISFLSQNNTGSVSLNVNCNESTSQSCTNNATGPGTYDLALRVFAGPAAVTCWNNNNNGNTCSGGVLVTFVTSPGASGTVWSPGVGYYHITGEWRVHDEGQGTYSPEGDEFYELDAVS